jgi:TIR domain
MIAISYRREDSTPVAGRLHDRLQADFGKKNVFMDFDSIPFGVDFRQHIKQTLERAKVVVAVIGPQWLGGKSRSNRRINDPSDFVRLEIATALERGIPVIPVLVDDTPMPQVADLPEDLRGLAFRNALVLDTGVDFHHHVGRLISGIRDLVGNDAQLLQADDRETKARGASTEKSSNRNKAVIAAIGICAAGLIVFLAWNQWTGGSRSRSSSSAETAATTPPPPKVETPAPSPALVAETTPPPAASSTPVPISPPAALTPFAAFTSAVSIPSPPPIAAPPPNFLGEDEVRAFIFDHYRATEQRDLATVLSHYGDTVDFFTYGQRNKAFVQNDIIKYFQRWPVTTFTVSNIQVARTSVDSVAIAYFDIRYFVRDLAANRSKQGRANEIWTISKSDGVLKIINQKETVYGDTPQPRTNRRR